MSLETTLNRFGINFKVGEDVEEQVDRLADDKFHVYNNLSGFGWVERGDKGEVFLTLKQLRILQGKYFGVEKPYEAIKQKDGSYLIKVRG